MRPARWRRSTHLLIGVIVLAAVVIVVALAVVLADGGATRSARAVAGTPLTPDRQARRRAGGRHRA